MEHVISSEIFGKGVKAIFTGKHPGLDMQRISEIMSVGKERIYMQLQRYTDQVIVLDADQEPKIGDALVTRQEGIIIGVQAADCLPILVYDTVARVVAAVHAGWRGTASGILKKTIRTMSDRFSSSPSEIVIAIGPGIRWCCYEVGYEVFEAVRKATGQGDYFRAKGEKYYLDLMSANKYQALSDSILKENIWIAGECTHCLPDMYYSYRYAKGRTGRQGGFIGIV